MIDSSPIESWDGAGAFFSFGPDTGMTVFIFWLAVFCCLIPLYFTLKTENEHETRHKFKEGDSDSTHGVERQD